MISSYVKTAFRRLARHKGYAFINILGLAVGLAATLLILVWVHHETGYDQNIPHGDEIYRFINNEKEGEVSMSFPYVPGPLMGLLTEDYASIRQAARVRWIDDVLVQVGDKSMFIDDVAFLDPQFFELFSIDFLQGKSFVSAQQQEGVLLSASTAARLFGAEGALGRTLTGPNDRLYEVTGIFEDIPEKSHMNVSMAFTVYSMPGPYNRHVDSWPANLFVTYIQVAPGTDANLLETELAPLVNKNTGNDIFTLSLQRLRDIHLHSSGLVEFATKARGDIRQVRLFMTLALVILILACINFVSLTTARGQLRAREVGMRKVTGARRSELMGQFLSETLAITLLALLLALLVSVTVLPGFNQLSGKSFQVGDFLSGEFLPLFLAIVLLAGIASGVYPAWHLSSFQPSMVLKAGFDRGKKGGRFRQILVLIQFSVTALLLFSTTVVYRQLSYIENRDMGFNEKHLLTVSLPEDVNFDDDLLRDALLSHSGVKGVSLGSNLPVERGMHRGAMQWPGKDPNYNPGVYFYSVDANYLPVLEMKVLTGRNFSQNLSTDRQNVIINEAAARIFKLNEPVGSPFSWGNSEPGIIVGVVKNFHFESIKKEVEPLVLTLEDGGSNLMVRYAPQQLAAVQQHLYETLDKFYPGLPLSIRYLDGAIDEIYRSDRRMGLLFRVLTGLAIFLSLLGLAGLASFTAQRRQKEIGIRKVLGSSVWSAVFLLIRNQLKWVVLANALAMGPAFFLMNQWLKEWAHHIPLPWYLYLTTLFLSVSMVVLAVGSQSMQAALTNPVRTLKQE